MTVAPSTLTFLHQLSAFAAAILFASTLQSRAQGVWDGGTAGDGTSWSEAANWAGGVLPSSGADVLFSSRTGGGQFPSPMNVGGARTFGLMTFDNVNGALPTTLNIATNDPLAMPLVTTARTLTINSGITLQNTSTSVVFQGGTGTLTIALGGDNVFTTSTGSLLQINSGVRVTGGFGIALAGAGSVALNNPNNIFTGGVTVGDGSTLRVGFGTAANPASSVVSGGVLASGQVGRGTLSLSNGSRVVSTGSGSRTLQNNMTLSGAVTFGATSSFTGELIFNSSTGDGAGQTLTTAATIQLLANSDLTVISPTTFANAVTGDFSLTKSGAGTLTLSGANTYSGGTFVNSGTLMLASNAAVPGSGTITVAAGATLGAAVGTSSGQLGSAGLDQVFASAVGGATPAVSGSIALDTTAGDFSYASNIPASNLGFTKLGPNTLTLSGTSGYAGMTRVSNGVLDIGLVSNGTLGSGGLFLENGAVLQGSGLFERDFSSNATPGPGQVAGVAGGFAAKGGELTLNFGGAGATVLLNTGASRFGGNLVFGSPTADSPVVVVNPLSTNGAFTRVITVNAGLGGDYALLQGAISSSGNIVKEGDGLLIIAANSTFTGTMTINGGIVQLGNGGTTGTVNSSSGVTINGGKLVFNRNNSFTFSPAITGAGVVEIAGIRASIATLAGTNSYTGSTILTSGSLNISAAANLGDAAADLVFDGGTLQITGTNLNSLSGLGRTVAFSTDKTVGFNINSLANSFTVDQVLNQGTGGLTKTGNGTLVLNQPSSYTGVTTLSGGVLDVGTMSEGTLGTGGLLFSNNAVLQGNGDFIRTFSGVANSAAPGELSGASGGFAARGGALTVNFGGSGASVTLNTGLARFGTNFVFGSATADSPVIVVNPLNTSGAFVRTFTVLSGVGGDYAELQGAISNSGSVVKEGPGLLVLSGNNTYSGLTTINNGTLQIGAGGTTGSVNATSGIVNNGVLAFDRQGELTMSAEISGVGQVNQLGTGNTRLLAANTYSGGTLVEGGTLVVANSSGSATGIGPLTTLMGTTLAGDGFIGTQGTEDITLNGLVSPGWPISELASLSFTTEDGDLIFGSTATALFQLGEGDLSDRLIFNSTGAGEVNFSAMASGSLQVLFGAGYSPALFDAFDLINWSAAVGSGMTGLNANQLGTLPTLGFEPTWEWDTSQFATQGVISIQLVPEPTRAVLLGLAALASILRRRRQG